MVRKVRHRKPCTGLPCVRNVQNRQSHTNRKYVNGCQDLEEDVGECWWTGAGLLRGLAVRGAKSVATQKARELQILWKDAFCKRRNTASTSREGNCCPAPTKTPICLLHRGGDPVSHSLQHQFWEASPPHLTLPSDLRSDDGCLG